MFSIVLNSGIYAGCRFYATRGAKRGDAVDGPAIVERVIAQEWPSRIALMLNNNYILINARRGQPDMCRDWDPRRPRKFA